MTDEEAAALQGLLAGGPMTPDQAAAVLCCGVCRGPVHPTGKPWYFKCSAGCAFSWKSTDVGQLQAAIRRRVRAALAPVSAVTPAEGMTD